MTESIVEPKPAAEGDLTFDAGIDLKAITTRLQKEREKLGRDGDERVCTMNLVACYFSTEGYEKARPALEVAGTLHPARLLVLVAESKLAGDRVRGRVSVVRNGSSVALERIELTATGLATRHLQSAMDGLFLPELPVVFIWGGRPEGALFEKALERADRVIIDSGTRTLPAFLQIARRVSNGAPIGDLAWARIFPWQAISAEMLDLPNLREHRRKIDSVRVIAAGQSGPEAALLAGWFAARIPRAVVEVLDGPMPSADQSAPSEPARAGKAAVHAPPIAEGQVAMVQFDAPPARFTIKRERGILTADVQGDDDGAVVHRVRMPAETPGRLMGLELKLLSGHDELYAASLAQAAKLLGLDLSKKSS